MRYLLLLVLAINFAGCASYFKRKNCEATNWYEYGQKVALEGRRLTGDQFISECNMVEADVGESALDRGFKSGLEMYCQPETVFQTGKNGNFFSTEMCIGQGLNTLQVKHKAGVLEYCQKSNGYAAGARGKAYNKICPADLEPAFLPEFNRGRKRYLNTVLAENEKQISRIDQEISRLQSDLRFRQIEFQRYHFVKKDGEVDKSPQLSSDIRQMQLSISSKQGEQNSLRNKNREIQLEIVQLED